MRDRKAQLAVFILVGIVILVAFAIIFFSTQNIISTKNVPGENVVTQSINSYVQSCLDATGKNAVWLIGRYGGYIYPDSEVKELSLDFGNAAYLYRFEHGAAINDLPSIPQMEEEISYYVSNEMKNCIDFKTFEDQGFVIITGVPDVTTTIRDKSVLLELDYPMTAKKGNIQVNLQNYKDTVEIQLGSMQEIANKTIQRIRDADMDGDATLISDASQYINNQPRFSFDYLFGFHPSLDTSYTFIPDQKSVLWIIHDYRARPEYMFIFATKHRQII